MSETAHRRDERDQRVLRRDEVVRITGLSASTIRRLELSGRFPQRRVLSANAIGWLSLEIEAWLRSLETEQ